MLQGIVDEGKFYHPPIDSGASKDEFAKTLGRFVTGSCLEQALDPDFDQPFVRFEFNKVVNQVLFDTDLIRHCFVENAANYIHSPSRQKWIGLATGQGLIVAEGEMWRKTQNALKGAFSASNLQVYADLTLAVATDYFDTRPRPASVFPLANYMQGLTFRVLCESLFSKDLRDREEELLAAISSFIEAYGGNGRIGIALAPYFLPNFPRVARLPAIRHFRAIISDFVDKRLASREPGGTDIVSRMLELAGETIPEAEMADFLKDNVKTLVLAGHETTASAISWTLFILSQSPNDLARARAEADSLFECGRPASSWHESGHFLRACIEETMRLYPPIPILARQALEDDDAAPVPIRKGSMILVVTALLQRQHRYWKNPSAFMPDRFMPQNRETLNRFAFLPFGAGPRTCLGANLAMRQSVILLAAFLRRFDFTYAAAEPPKPLMRVVTRSDNKIPMLLTERRARVN